MTTTHQYDSQLLAVRRQLPQTPYAQSSSLTPISAVQEENMTETTRANTFYAQSHGNGMRGEIARSQSDNKHCNSGFLLRKYRAGVQSTSSAASSPKPQHIMLTRLQQQDPNIQKSKREASVLRSHSQLTPRQSQDLTPIEKGTNRIRYSCDGNAATSSTGNTQLTLILMGAPMVGKSAIVNQFLFEIFPRDYRPTVEEFNWIEYGSDSESSDKNRRYSSSNFSSSSSIDSNDSERSSNNSNANGARNNLLLQIIDSSGSRDFLAMRYLYYNIGDAFMIVYSLNDPSSYAEALLIAREIQQQNSKNAPILLIANKTDLEEIATDSEVNSKCRPTILSTFPLPQNIDFMRLSAKNLYQVKQAFNRLIDKLAQRSEICGGVSRRAQLQKRRQSLPSRRTANELGIDAETLERLLRQHNSHARHAQCTIS